MAKLFIEDTTLSAIGDAIRSKTGSSDLIAPLDMPTAIGSIEAGGGSDITSWDIDRQTSSAGWIPITSNGLIDKYLDGKSFTVNITSGGGLANLFNGCTAKDLSKVVINHGGGYGQAFLIFSGSEVEQLPVLNVLDSCTRESTNFRNIFQNCYRLRNIDEDFWTNLMSVGAESGSYQLQGIFKGCYSLRQLPDLSFIGAFENTSGSANYNLYYQMVNTCYSLDTMENIPVVGNNMKSNLFYQTFAYCSRLKDMIFATNENGTPKTANWSNQLIPLAAMVGYGDSGSKSYIINQNSGITADKEIKDDATYQALKDDPDSWTINVAYSRYNHDSAVRTINSLPDTSAFLAANGGTNTITFNGASGSATDGGAISNLTEDEIAVATAKGWTVQIV